MARTITLTDDVLAQVAKHIRLGLPKKDAAVLAGLDRHTYHLYIQRGQESLDHGKRDRYTAFVNSVARAEADFKLSCHAAIIQAAQQPQHWQAAAWLLKHRHPADYVDRTEIAGTPGQPIEIRVQTAEELLVEVRQLAQQRQDVHEPLALPPAPGDGHTNGHSNGSSR